MLLQSLLKTVDYVQSYDISLLEDGSYQLNFTLTKNIVPTFEYNEELERHQIRLNDGAAKRRYHIFTKLY